MIDSTDGELLYQEIQNKQNHLERLYTLVEILRNHCEWDKKQTFESLKDSLLEEAYEVIQGIEEQDVEILKEEIGDLLFLIHFYIKLCEEKQYFSKEDVYDFIINKLIERHPHVFKNLRVKDTTEILKNWEGFKKKSFGENTEFLPALMRAHKIQKKASLEGFDWQPNENHHIKEILDQLKSEISELEKELIQNNKDNIEMEIGDILFSVVNLARHLDLSAELALHKSIEKFIKRFNKVMEIYQKEKDDRLNKQSQLEEIYQRIKKEE